MKQILPLRITVLVAFLFMIITSSLLAQVSDKVASVNAKEGKEGEPMPISVELSNAVSINQMFINYRSAGMSEYKRIEMTLTGNTATATIPGPDVVPPNVEYYFVMTILLKDEYVTFPVENPKNNPLSTPVKPTGVKEQMVVFLSPDNSKPIPHDDLFFALSLRNVSPLIDISTLKLYVDGNDITSAAAISTDLVTVDPSKIPMVMDDGNHVLRVDLFDKKGQLYHTQTLRFTQSPLFNYVDDRTHWNYSISSQLETRHEEFSGISNPYNRGFLAIKSNYGILNLNGRLFVSNEENSNRQPVNQYFAEAYTSWLRVAYGDDYPTFPELIMRGKRLRGLTSNLKLGFFNVDFAMGQVSRSIEGEVLRTLPQDSVQNQQGAFGPYDTTNGNNIWAEYKYGTYKREITAIRPSFGAGESFQWGFSYLKAKDDVGSIHYGIKPQENLVLGSDIFIGAFQRKLQITLQGGTSILNTDISGGNISDSQIDSLFTGEDSEDKRKQFRDIRDIVSKYITVNQNLVPLSTEKISSVMAYEGGIALDAFDNYLKGTYLFHGSQYQSFGQTFFRKDVKGFNIYDRIRLVENQLFLSGTYENLKDNTDETKVATTTYSNWNGTVSYYPRLKLPNITVGYGQNSSMNGLSSLSPTGPDSLKAQSAREDLTSRVYVQLGYEFLTDFLPGARHNATASVSVSNSDDKTFRNIDSKNSSVSTMLTTVWKMPLQTTLGLSFSNSTFPAGALATQTDLNYTTLSLSARYRLLNDKLRLSASVVPTFGDVERSVLSFIADYNFWNAFVASGEATLINNSNGGTSDSIFSFLLKYNM